MIFTIIDASQQTNGSLRYCCAGDLPEAKCILETGEMDLRVAQAKALRLVKAGTERVLILNPEDPGNPETTRLFRADLLESSNRYRVLCGNWERCSNPGGIFTAHYSAPSKSPDRRGPLFCRHCHRIRGPRPEDRAATAARNISRTGPRAKKDTGKVDDQSSAG